MNKIIIFCCLLMVTLLSKAQTVSTYAGTQYEGDDQYSGVGVNLLADEKYSFPQNMCLDTNNRIYLTDDHNISLLTNGYCYTRGGALTRPGLPGSIGKTNGLGIVSRFHSPFGVAVLKSTNDVYVTDQENYIIRKGTSYVNSSNGTTWSTYAGTTEGHKDGAVATAKFGVVKDIVITSDGTMYIADFGNEVIRKIQSGVVSTIVGTVGQEGDLNGIGTAALISSPVGLFLENDNSLLIADRNNKKIKRVNLTSLEVTTVVSGLFLPTDMVNFNNNIYIADNHAIKLWNGSTLSVFSGNEITSGYVNGSLISARFNTLEGLLLNKATSTLYIADKGNNVVRKLTLTNSPVADFTASNISPTIDQTIILENITSTATSQTWLITPNTYTLQAGSTLTSKKIFVSFSSATSYNVILTTATPLGSLVESRTNYINVSNLVTAVPTANFTADKTAAAKAENVQLIDLSGNNPKTFKWTFTPSVGVTYQNATTETSKNPIVKFANDGKYAVKLETSNLNGSNITTKPDYIIVGNASTNVTQIMVSVRPNPATSIVFLPTTHAKFLTLTTLNGSIINLPIVNNSIDVSNITNGLYWLSIIDTNKNFTSKLIVNK